MGRGRRGEGREEEREEGMGGLTQIRVTVAITSGKIIPMK